MQRIKFEYPPGAPTSTVQFIWGIEMNAPTWRFTAGSAIKRAFDGTVHAAVKGVSERQIPLTLNILTESERDEVIDFVQNVVEGRYRVFRYTDQDNYVYDVRFLDETFDFGDGTVPYSFSVTLVEV